MSRTSFALAGVALLLVLAIHPSPVTAQAWPDGEILATGYNTALGWARVRLLPGDPGTFYLATRPTLEPFGWTEQPMTAAGDFGTRVGMATSAYAPDHAGNLVYLRYDTNTTLALGAVEFAGEWSETTPITGGTGQYTPAMTFSCTDRAEGGAWFMWPGDGVRLLRAAPGGAVAFGWSESGWRLSASGDRGVTPLGMASDGAGGVLALLVPDVLRVFRVTGSAAFAIGWPAEGLALETAPASYLGNPQSHLLRSDATHFIAVWAAPDPASPQNTALKCQRFSLDGALDPAWPAAGRVLVTLPAASLGDGSPEGLFKLLPDGSGGVTVAWIGGFQVWATHVLADGSLAAGFASGPRALVDLPAKAFGLVTGPSGTFCVVAAGLEWSLRARWFDGNGDPWPSPAQYEWMVFTAPQLESGWARMTGVHEHRLDALSDGDGGFYCAWTSAYPPPYSAGDWISMTHLSSAGGQTGVPPAPPAVLALAAGPNPARGSLTARFTLPDERPARLELLDPAGRRVAARAVSGAGAHTERLTDLGALAPGVYLLRLSHGGEVRTARVALVR